MSSLRWVDYIIGKTVYIWFAEDMRKDRSDFSTQLPDRELDV